MEIFDNFDKSAKIKKHFFVKTKIRKSRRKRTAKKFSSENLHKVALENIIVFAKMKLTNQNSREKSKTIIKTHTTVLHKTGCAFS